MKPLRVIAAFSAVKPLRVTEVLGNRTAGPRLTLSICPGNIDRSPISGLIRANVLKCFNLDAENH